MTPKKLFDDFSQVNDELEVFIEKLPEYEKLREELAKYYQGSWIDDYHSKDDDHMVYSEDGIFELLMDFDYKLRKINKELALLLLGDDE